MSLEILTRGTPAATPVADEDDDSAGDSPSRGFSVVGVEASEKKSAAAVRVAEISASAEDEEAEECNTITDDEVEGKLKEFSAAASRVMS